jgi:hypothetical protein
MQRPPSKLTAGLLQILLTFGTSRCYTGMAVGQLLVVLFTGGLGAIWPIIDGIILLASGDIDPHGRPPARLTRAGGNLRCPAIGQRLPN